MRVGVCVPCRDEVHTGFAFDFARMAAHDASVRCKDGKGGLSLYTMPGTLIFDQREKLAEVALRKAVTHCCLSTAICDSRRILLASC